jgi:hypothetical protein
VVHPSRPVATFAETSFSPGVRAIFTELRRLGYVERKNILIERYSGEGRAAHYPDLARDVGTRQSGRGHCHWQWPRRSPWQGWVGLDLIEKRVQLLQQVVPHASRFWILQSRAMGDQWQAEWRESARMLGGHLRLERRSAGEAGANVFLNTFMIWQFSGMLLY